MLAVIRKEWCYDKRHRRPGKFEDIVEQKWFSPSEGIGIKQVDANRSHFYHYGGSRPLDPENERHWNAEPENGNPTPQTGSDEFPFPNEIDQANKSR